MNSQASHKCSLHALGYALGASFVILLAGWIWLAIDNQDFWATALGVLVPVAAVLVFAWTRLFLAKSGCELREAGLIIHRAFGSIEILYPSVTRVERVRRVSGSRSELVRISFRSGGGSQAVSVRAAYPKLLAADIVTRCPQLKSASPQKISRDPSFRMAEDFIKGRNPGEPAGEWF